MVEEPKKKMMKALLMRDRWDLAGNRIVADPVKGTEVEIDEDSFFAGLETGLYKPLPPKKG